MPTAVEQAEQKVKQETQSLYQRAYAYTLTPYPAWTFASALLASPLVSKSQVPVRVGLLSSPFKLFSRAPNIDSTTAAGAGHAAKKLIRVGPSNLSVALFGAASALGGYMAYDGDYLNGAGFTMAWLALYILANGRNTINAVKYGRPWPVVLMVGALTNATLYGKRFIWNK